MPARGQRSEPRQQPFVHFFLAYQRVMRAILHHPDTPILGAAGGLMAATLACSLIAPPLFGLLLTVSVGAGIAFLALRFPTRFCVAWLLITGMSLEMTLHDLVGDEAYQPTIALIKGIEIGLGLLCILRFGPKLDLLCPAWAYAAMLLAGLVHGLYPALTAMDSLRSMIGSAAPFVFCFCRLPRSWADAMIRATKWCPIVAVVAGLPLAAADIRPLFVESGGARLAGLGHPAFLAGVCLPAIYACLIQLYREGRRGDLTAADRQRLDPGADRRPRPAGLCRRGDGHQPGLDPLRRYSPPATASC